MSKDKHSGSDPGFSMSEEDEAFLRVVEDSYEAAGRPKDQPGADRIWSKLESRLVADVSPQKPVESTPDSQVHSLDAARKRRRWLFMSSTLGLAAAVVLFVNFQPTVEEPGAMQTRGTASGFAAEIKVVDEPIPGAPADTPHHVKVNVTADSDGFIALFRQSGAGGPAFVSNLEYKKNQGSMHILEEDAASGTRYCIVGAKDQEGLKHLVELIPDLWAYLPTTSCYSVP